MTPAEVSEFRGLLDAERERIASAIASLHESGRRTVDDEGGERGRRRRRHRLHHLRPRARRGARGGRGANARRRSTARSQRLDDGTLRHLRALRRADRRRAAARAPVGDALHRRPAAGRPGVARGAPAARRPRRLVDQRRSLPVSVAERSLAAGPWEWLGPRRGRRGRGRRRPAHQAPRDEPASPSTSRTRGRRAALDPPARQLGHRLRPLHLGDRAS